GLAFDACNLDVDRGDACRRIRQCLAQLHLSGPEPAQLLAEHARACATRVDTRAEGRFEPLGSLDCTAEHGIEALGAGEDTRQLVRTGTAAAGTHCCV